MAASSLMYMSCNLVLHVCLQLVLLVGTKLQHVIATLALENAFFAGAKLRPRNDLFWFKKPELLLSLIHFILFQVGKNYYDASADSCKVIFFFFFEWSVLYFSIWKVKLMCMFLSLFYLSLQNAFELASFFWFWVLSLPWLHWYLECSRWLFQLNIDQSHIDLEIYFYFLTAHLLCTLSCVCCSSFYKD